MDVYNPGQKANLYCGRPLLIHHSLNGVTDSEDLYGQSLREFCDFVPPWERCTRIVIGTGTDLDKFIEQYPDVIFVGEQTETECAVWYASAEAVIALDMEITYPAHRCGAMVIPGLGIENYLRHIDFSDI